MDNNCVIFSLIIFCPNNIDIFNIQICFIVIKNLPFCIYFSGKAGINVAETVKALTELKHTPASPSLLRRNSNLQNQTQPPNAPNNTSTPQPMLSSFQQSKSTFTQLQNNTNLNPIYGPAGHKLFSYAEQTNNLHSSRNSSFTNLSANSSIYGCKEQNNSTDVYDTVHGNRLVSSSYSATVTYSSSPNSSSNYMETSLSSFGQRTPGNQTPSTPIYGQTTFGKQQPMNNLNQFDKKNPFAAANSSQNSIYAQPSQIIAGFNNLGFGGNRSQEGSMSPMAIRKTMNNSRSQSADRRGSDCKYKYFH